MATSVWENVQAGMSVEVVEARTAGGTNKVISFNAPGQYVCHRYFINVSIGVSFVEREEE